MAESAKLGENWRGMEEEKDRMIGGVFLGSMKSSFYMARKLSISELVSSLDGID